MFYPSLWQTCLHTYNTWTVGAGSSGLSSQHFLSCSHYQLLKQHNSLHTEQTQQCILSRALLATFIWTAVSLNPIVTKKLDSKIVCIHSLIKAMPNKESRNQCNYHTESPVIATFSVLLQLQCTEQSRYSVKNMCFSIGLAPVKHPWLLANFLFPGIKDPQWHHS